MTMLHVGYGHYVQISKIMAISSVNNSGNFPKPIKALIENAKQADMVIDHTNGRRTNTVIHLDDGYLVLCSVWANTLVKRMKDTHRLDEIEFEG